ncbi:hypothetical protein [Diplocloster hominis]|uniref:hypothetical protein n=1 Tax=Diplocloster hominis TaxID=3079010 RepID=UPI0031BB998B
MTWASFRMAAPCWSLVAVRLPPSVTDRPPRANSMPLRPVAVIAAPSCTVRVL